MTTTLGSTFTTTVRVIMRIQGRSANMRTNALPAIPSGLADPNRIMLRIAHFPNRRTSLARYPTDFTAWELQLGPTALSSHQNR
jgi:hypothetical protein